ncbi:MAG: glycosyltransferase family 2 protein [Vicinamibacterales bacterium]
MADIGISIVMPAFNEAPNLTGLVRRACGTLDGIPGEHEVIVVNDGSRDDTPRILDGLAGTDARVRAVTHDVNRGYGAAQRSGLQAARGDWVWVIPADGQIAPEELPAYLLASTEADVVVGRYRNRPDSTARLVFSRFYRATVRALFGLSLTNINAPKLYRRSSIAHLRTRANGGFADAELVLQAHAGGCRIVEIDVTCLPRQAGVSSVTWRAALQAVAELIRFHLAFRVRGRR